MMKDGRRCHIVWVQGISECLDCVDFFTCPYRVLLLSLSCKVCGVRTFPSRHWRAKCRRLTTNNWNTQAPRGGRLLDVSADGQHVRSDTSQTLILTITVALSVSDFLGLCFLHTVQACPSILNNTCVEALGLCYSCPVPAVSSLCWCPIPRSSLGEYNRSSTPYRCAMQKIGYPSLAPNLDRTSGLFTPMLFQESATPSLTRALSSHPSQHPHHSPHHLLHTPHSHCQTILDQALRQTNWHWHASLYSDAGGS